MMRIVVLGLLGVLVIAGCRSGGAAAEKRAKAATGDWVLEWMHGRGPVTPPESQRTPTITIGADGALKGHTGVNRLSGGVDAEAMNKGEFRSGPVAMTKMAGPPDAMALESEFVGLLSNATRYRVDEGPVLVLSNESGELLRFGRTSSSAEEKPVRSIEGEWVVDWMEGREGVAPPAGRTAPWVSIAADGTLRGWTGVNHLSGRLDADALKRGEFAAGPMAMTEMGAEPDAMQLERDFVGLLGRAQRLRVDEGPRLVLSDSTGEVLRFVRKP